MTRHLNRRVFSKRVLGSLAPRSRSTGPHRAPGSEREHSNSRAKLSRAAERAVRGSQPAFMAATKFSSTFCCSPEPTAARLGATGGEQQDSDSRQRDGSRGPRQTT